MAIGTTTYKLMNDPIMGGSATSVKKTYDGNISFIPLDPLNIDYQAYLEWVAEGNTADPVD